MRTERREARSFVMYREKCLAELRNVFKKKRARIESDHVEDDDDFILTRSGFILSADFRVAHRLFKKRRQRAESQLSRSPIYRALSDRGRMDLQLRMPASWNPKHALMAAFLDESLKNYEREDLDGVCPSTVMALLVPEPYYIYAKYAVAPRLVIPEPVSFGERETSRRTDAWHVLLWAAKRYLAISWNQLSSLSPELQRSPSSLRHTVRRMVEEPIAGYYKKLTAKTLSRQLYSCSLADAPESPDRDRNLMRLLKREAQRRRLHP